MLGCVGHRQTGFFSQHLDGSRPLAKEIQKFQSFGTGDRFADTGKLFVNRILKKSIRIFRLILLKYSINKLINRINKIELFNSQVKNSVDAVLMTDLPLKLVEALKIGRQT